MLQFPSGVIADRIGSVQVIIIGAILTGIGSLIVAINSSVIILTVGMIIIGVGTGVHKTVTIGLLSRTYKNNTGRIFGIFDTIGSYGGVGAPTIATLFLVAPDPISMVLSNILGANWRGVFFLSGFIVIGLAAVFVFIVDSGTIVSGKNSRENDTPSLTDYINQFKNKRFIIFVMITILFSFSYNGIISFLPLYLTEEVGFSNSSANILYSLVFVVSFVQIITGDLSDRVGELIIIVGALFIASLSLVLLITLAQQNIVLLGGILILYSLGSNGFRPVRSLYLIKILPDSITSGGLGTVRTLLMGAGSIAPMIVGSLADSVNFQFAFIILSTFLLMSAVLAGVLLINEYYN